VLTERRMFFATPAASLALSSSWTIPSVEDANVIRRELLDVVRLWQNGTAMLANKQIKPLTPPPACDGVWEFRATQAPPGARIIGIFPERNIFVATGVYPRHYLGNRGSRGWVTAIGYAVGRRAAWFAGSTINWPSTAKFTGSDLGTVCDVF